MKFFKFFDYFTKTVIKHDRYKTDGKLAKSIYCVCNILLGLMTISLIGLGIHLFKAASVDNISYIIILILAIISIICAAVSLFSFIVNEIIEIINYCTIKDTITFKKFNKILFVINILSIILETIGLILIFVLTL